MALTLLQGGSQLRVEIDGILFERLWNGHPKRDIGKSGSGIHGQGTITAEPQVMETSDQEQQQGHEGWELLQGLDILGPPDPPAFSLYTTYSDRHGEGED